MIKTVTIEATNEKPMHHERRQCIHLNLDADCGIPLLEIVEGYKGVEIYCVMSVQSLTLLRDELTKAIRRLS